MYLFPQEEHSMSRHPYPEFLAWGLMLLATSAFAPSARAQAYLTNAVFENDTLDGTTVNVIGNNNIINITKVINQNILVNDAPGATIIFQQGSPTNIPFGFTAVPGAPGSDEQILTWTPTTPLAPNGSGVHIGIGFNGGQNTNSSQVMENVFVGPVTVNLQNGQSVPIAVANTTLTRPFVAGDGQYVVLAAQFIIPGSAASIVTTYAEFQMGLGQAFTQAMAGWNNTVPGGSLEFMQSARYMVSDTLIPFDSLNEINMPLNSPAWTVDTDPNFQAGSKLVGLPEPPSFTIFLVGVTVSALAYGGSRRRKVRPILIQ
jgi:hypothetical protein